MTTASYRLQHPYDDNESKSKPDDKPRNSYDRSDNSNGKLYVMDLLTEMDFSGVNPQKYNAVMSEKEEVGYKREIV